MRRTGVASAALVLLLTAGCSREEPPTLPAACRTGPAAFQDALASAPGDVRLEGTRLSECVSEANDSADIQSVGATFVDVAIELVPRAEAEPEGRAATQLGYLVGAARRGADRTQGFHDEMVRRLEQETAPVERRSNAFLEGRRAGLESG